MISEAGFKIKSVLFNYLVNSFSIIELSCILTSVFAVIILCLAREEWLLLFLACVISFIFI